MHAIESSLTPATTGVTAGAWCGPLPRLGGGAALRRVWRRATVYGAAATNRQAYHGTSGEGRSRARVSPASRRPSWRHGFAGLLDREENAAHYCDRSVRLATRAGT